MERDRGEQGLVVYRDGEAANGFGALEFHHKGAALPDGREIDAAGLFDDPAFFGPDSGIRDSCAVLGYERQSDEARREFGLGIDSCVDNLQVNEHLVSREVYLAEREPETSDGAGWAWVGEEIAAGLQRLRCQY